MNLFRTPLILLRESAVPTNWPTRVGYPSPGVTRKESYPAGLGGPKLKTPADGEYPCSPEGKKIAKAHAWQFPSKRIKVCDKTMEY